MNTLKIEAKLADKYKYKALPEELSQKYREFFTENIPNWLPMEGDTLPLYTCNGSIITCHYDRIVVGDYGAFIEFKEPIYDGQFVIAPGQEYRVNDDRYSSRVKYEWLTINDGSRVKIYRQKRTVSYADYKPDRYYVSVHEVFPEGGNRYEAGKWDMFFAITSAWYGKQCYGLENNGMVYSRRSCQTMEREAAYTEFIDAIADSEP